MTEEKKQEEQENETVGEQEVAKTEESSVVDAPSRESLLADLNENCVKSEGFTFSDLKIPRTRLLQKTSDEINKEIEGFKTGMIIDHVNRNEMPENFIPIYAHKSYIRFNPYEEKDPNFDKEKKPGDLLFRARSLTDPAFNEETRKMLDFGPNGERPLIRTHFDYWCCFEGWNYPVVLSLPISNKESRATAEGFASMYEMMQTRDTKYKLSSRRIDKDKASYYVYQIDVAGKATQEELELLVKWNKNISQNIDQMQESAYNMNNEDAVSEEDRGF